MTPDRRQQIEDLYSAARTHPENAGEAFLRQACAGDEVLHREVRARLDQAAAADGLLKSQGVDIAVHELHRAAAGSLEGRRLGMYKVGRLLGAGGMGEVYQARDTRLDRKVAVKVLPDAFAADPERLARFEREARLAAALNHPNICTIHEVGEADGRVFIAMEYVDGRPLGDVLPAHGLSNDETLRYGVQIADALAHAHEHAIVHRDLKTANVMITAEGRVKVLDFGLAKRVDGSELDDVTRSAPVSLTAPGALAGTVPYMAPEQLRGQPADVRSDTWALGVILYEMAAGRRPFAGQTTFELSSAILHEPPPRLPTKVLPALSAVIERCLEKEPARRYHRTEEARAVLETIQDMRPTSRGAVPSRRTVLRRSTVAAVVLVLAVAGVLAGWFLKRNADLRRAEDGIAQVTQFAERDDYAAALALARDVERLIHNDTRLSSLLRRVSVTRPIESVPAGADVYIKRWDDADSAWELVGRTPIAEARLPRGISRWKVQKDGFQPLEFIVTNDRIPADGRTVHLRPNDSVPQMVMVPSSNGSLYQRLRYYDSNTSTPLGAFLIDKYEVTNEQFKQFVDAGGYTKREYWTQAFVRDGKAVTWEQAMGEFRDRTGRPGPSTWQAGAYRVGQSQYPVAGVSWYEAVAYAKFVGKSLPTAYHWVQAAGPQLGAYIAPLSNIEGKGVVPVGSRPGVSPFGAFDVAGNVREWVWNESTPGSTRAILGGAWTDPAYYFQEVVARSPFDRSDTNGFRLVQYSDSQAVADTLTGPIPPASRDYSKETPVSDEVFRVYQNLFAYDPQALDAKVESIDRSAEQWVKEKVSFAAAYDRERVPAYLFLPRNTRPPYQTVVYFPGAGATSSLTSDELPTDTFDFLMLSGRAVLYPVYKGTYERRIDHPAPMSRAYSTWVMQFINDVRRGVDYLETRQDIQKSGFAYYGFSWGAARGPSTLALDPRFKVGLFVVGGLQPFKMSPEVDDFNFAPRVKVPVLMLNGDSDSTFPVDMSQKRLFTLLGTPSEHKRHVVYPGGHEVFAVRPSQVAREALDWLDRYLGPVQR